MTSLRINRREFTLSALGTAAALALPSHLRAATTPLLSAVEYSQVTMRGPLQQQLDDTIHTLLGLEDDALLAPYRKLGGLPAPGTSLSGWYAADGFAPGHALGQWMSGLARYYAITGNDAARVRLARLISLHADSMRDDGAFFRENHFPAYTYDKLLFGLMEAQTLAHNPQARHSMDRLTTIAAPYLPEHAISRNEMCALPKDPVHYCYDESYTLSENQFLAWKLTGDPRYLATGRRLLNDAQFFTPLDEGKNALIDQHAYSHMNELSSGMQAYLTLDDPKYLKAVTNAFALVEQQSFATGGWGPEEAFVNPASDRLDEDMSGTHRGFETPCGSYAHLKLGRYLLRTTGDARYGDSMERVLYNTIAGVLPLQPDGHAFYYADYNWQSSKTYFPDRWPCCSGSLPMVLADYGISSYFRDAGGVFVNLYLPSTLHFSSSNGTRVTLTQSGDYPVGNQVAIHLQVSRPAQFSVRLRIPAWAAGAGIRINGKPAETPATPGTFAAATRTWRSGDRIEMTLPLPMRLEPLSPQHPEIAALVRGPIALFALTDQAAKQPVDRAALLDAQPVAGRSGEFRAGDLRLVPYTALAAGQPYSLYLRLAAAGASPAPLVAHSAS